MEWNSALECKKLLRTFGAIAVMIDESGQIKECDLFQLNNRSKLTKPPKVNLVSKK